MKIKIKKDDFIENEIIAICILKDDGNCYSCYKNIGGGSRSYFWSAPMKIMAKNFNDLTEKDGWFLVDEKEHDDITDVIFNDHITISLLHENIKKLSHLLQ